MVKVDAGDSWTSNRRTQPQFGEHCCANALAVACAPESAALLLTVTACDRTCFSRNLIFVEVQHASPIQSKRRNWTDLGLFFGMDAIQQCNKKCRLSELQVQSLLANYANAMKDGYGK